MKKQEQAEVKAIRSIADIQKLVLSGVEDWSPYGHVYGRNYDDLVILCYTKQAELTGSWNWFEINARGLILNRNTGEVVARPFRKFFNYGQRLPMPGSFIMEVTEKVDGSLGILYRHKGQFRISTKGEFQSEQAIWATEYLNKHHDISTLADNYTLLFEIIYPKNRIVVDYGDFESLVLIGARDRIFGQELYYSELQDIANRYGFVQPKTYPSFTKIDQLLEEARTISYNEEGWVIRYSDNERFKVKGDAYLALFRALNYATKKHAIEAIRDGHFDAILKEMPDEFLDQLHKWRDEVAYYRASVLEMVEKYLAKAPTKDAKKFIEWVNKEIPDKRTRFYVIAGYRGRNLDESIYEHLLQDERKERKFGG